MGTSSRRLKQLGYQSITMKINVAYPATGCQKLFEINDEIKVRPFYEKRMGQEVDAATLGDEWAGYVFRITGGNDKQGFPMKQGVLTQGRVRLLLSKGHTVIVNAVLVSVRGNRSEDALSTVTCPFSLSSL